MDNDSTLEALSLSAGRRRLLIPELGLPSCLLLFGHRSCPHGVSWSVFRGSAPTWVLVWSVLLSQVRSPWRRSSWLVFRGFGPYLDADRSRDPKLVLWCCHVRDIDARTSLRVKMKHIINASRSERPIKITEKKKYLKLCKEVE